MKTHRKAYKPLIFIALTVSTLGLVAWSPPTNEDILVTTGSPAIDLNSSNSTLPNDLNGSTNNTNFTAFRGIIGGRDNKVGNGGATGYAGVFGSTNFGNAAASVIAGNDNSFAIGATSFSEALTYSGMFGYGNVMAKNTSGVLVAGHGNSGYAIDSLISGSTNTLDGPTTGSSTSYSAAVGYFNHVKAHHGYALGLWNDVNGSRGAAIGTGALVSTASTSTVALGKYNAETVADDVLVVGNGTSTSVRSTALSVKADGSVILGKAQGDISMGVYGN